LQSINAALAFPLSAAAVANARRISFERMALRTALRGCGESRYRPLKLAQPLLLLQEVRLVRDKGRHVYHPAIRSRAKHRCMLLQHR
jgi:hypothetical protein